MNQSELHTTAELAHLELSDDEAQRLANEVGRLVEYFELMSNADLGDETGADADANTATGEAGALTLNGLRPDTPRDYDVGTDSLLEAAEDIEDRFIAIPNVL